MIEIQEIRTTNIQEIFEKQVFPFCSRKMAGEIQNSDAGLYALRITIGQ